MGRSDEAVEHAERSIQLDPYNPLYRALYGVVLLFDRRSDDALAAARAALDLHPENPFATGVLQQAFIAKGLKEEQLEQQRERIARDPERVEAFERGLADGGYEGAQLAIADLLAGRYEMAEGVPGLGARRVFLANAIALRYIDGGDTQSALDWLEGAYEARDPNFPYLGLPLFDPLRPDSRFQALARKMKPPHVTAVETSYQG
jgi:tetratricopeptide (TPR) repeat protein